MVLTGDNKLRKEAQRQGFVYGIIRILLQLEVLQIIHTSKAIEALSEWMNARKCSTNGT